MTVLERYEEIRSRMAKAAREAGRSDEATLVAVTKTFAAPDIEPVLAAGHRVFGENRVQEAQGKWPALRERFDGVELHLIGPLQTNKARQAMELFDAIETVDRSKLARTIARLKDELGHCPKLYVQVNTGAEEQKAGVTPEAVDTFIAECRELGLEIAGLMCIPPVDEEPSLHFALLAKIAARNGIEELSMGMSADFETAIAQGATTVRVGSAVFGDRVYS